MPDPAAAPESIAIRMYRGLLGDCFLLTHRRGDAVYRALIDCGVLQCIGANKPNTKAALDHIDAVVADLQTETGSHLDLMVATHEHYDHLAGFLRRFDIFQNFTIDQLWLGWTEDRQDDEAQRIRDNGRRALSALAQVVDHADKKPFALDADKDRVESVRQLLQFYGEIDPPEAGGMGLAAAPAAPRAPRVPPRSCADVLDWLKSRAKNTAYLEPGDLVTFGIGNRLKAHVLGPPRTGSRLLQLNPSEGAAREVYLVQPDDVNAMVGTLNSVTAPEEDPALRASNSPFSARFTRWIDEKDTDGDALSALYYASEAQGRRIDGEWLGSAELLALKIDGDVNNTSLALAIELPGRQTLVFPGDAQVGNWLSWGDQHYPHDPNDKDSGETIDELLARAIFYKVGHHASHNATARERGLELMTHPDLVAMIPVVAAVAGEQKTGSNPDGWAMPYGDLYARLRVKTHERIIRGDGVRADEEKAFAGSVFQLHYSGAETEPLWAELRMGL